jgi:hemerythrin superfamily protein
MERLVERIDAATADDWRPLFDQLVDAVIHHANHEENNIFPKAQEAIGDKAAKDLEPRFLAAKKQIMATA